ncbi:unnamed protein product [Soboliphyme baturini]|uniref:Secreted protein n=1 Tax=Soboliphyme baturini TaxID=241478 RepID=A0A183IGB3_9BILA|nr:unnamed protein product [Soboliphyme baturini]
MLRMRGRELCCMADELKVVLLRPSLHRNADHSGSVAHALENGHGFNNSEVTVVDRQRDKLKLLIKEPLHIAAGKSRTCNGWFHCHFSGMEHDSSFNQRPSYCPANLVNYQLTQ